MTSQPETDSGMAVIAARFGIGAGLGLGGAEDQALAAAGMPRAARRKRPIYPFNFPPQIITGTSVGSYSAPGTDQSGPATGWFWDITSLTASGFTAGAIAVSKNAPFVTSAGNSNAIEPVANFTAAGVLYFPQRGMPLLDGNDYLVFTVTSALTGTATISGSVVMVPADRIDEYLS